MTGERTGGSTGGRFVCASGEKIRKHTGTVRLCTIHKTRKYVL